MLRTMLDTDICIYAMRERPPALRDRLNRAADRLCISVVTFMELSFGAENSSNPERNRAALAEFAAATTVLDYDRRAAVHTGEIRALLKRAGKPIGPYDAMIAGHARSQGLSLVTHNQSEFARVPGLELEDWAL